MYVGGRPLGAAATGDASTMKNRCESRPAFDPFKGSEWNGWGFDSGNSRFQTVAGPDRGRRAEAGAEMGVRFPNGNSAYGQPSVVGGRVFVGADTGFVYALDAATRLRPLVVPRECRRADGDQRSARVRRKSVLAYFGDVKGNVYAVDAETGARSGGSDRSRTRSRA